LIISSSNFSARNDKYGIVCQSYFNVHRRIIVMQQKTKKICRFPRKIKKTIFKCHSSWEGKIWYWLLHAWVFPANLWQRWRPSLKKNVLITPVKHEKISAVFHREIVVINNYVTCFSLMNFQCFLHYLLFATKSGRNSVAYSFVLNCKSIKPLYIICFACNLHILRSCGQSQCRFCIF
jgi:hypothetical protein